MDGMGEKKKTGGFTLFLSLIMSCFFPFLFCFIMIWSEVLTKGRDGESMCTSRLAGLGWLGGSLFQI